MEMLVVIAIIGILMTLAIPNMTPKYTIKEIRESITLVENYKSGVQDYYASAGSFPLNNETILMPEPDKIIGNFINKLSLEKGVLTLKFGNKANSVISGKLLSIQPVYVEGSLASPLSWVCGFDEVPAGMNAAGSNQTNIEKQFLPLECR